MQLSISKIFSWYTGNIEKVLTCTCGLVLLAVALERLGIVFSYEAHTAGIDNNFDYAVVRSLAGYSIYPNPSDYPYAVNPYAPLFFILCKGGASLLHITAADTMLVYRCTRAVCLLADTGTGICLYWIFRRLNVKNTAAVCGLAVFFAILCFLGYTINRADALFLFFYCASILLLLSPQWLPPALYTTGLALLATMCLYSKQNGISLMVLIPAWFVIEKNYRRLFQFLFIALLFSAGLFFYFEYVFTDHFFYDHTIHALKNRIDPRWFYVFVFKLMAGSWLTLPLGAALVLAARLLAETKSTALKQLSSIFVLQLTFNLVLSFKWGSSVGYFNESFLLGIVLITGFCSSSFAGSLAEPVKMAAACIYPAAAIFFLHIVLQLFFFFLNSRTEAREKFNEQARAAGYIRKEIGNQERYVTDLSDADFNFFKTLLYKEAAAPNIDAVSCCTLPGKLFDYSGFLKGFTSGKIMFIISKDRYLPESLWEASTGSYKKDTSFGAYNIFRYTPSVQNR